ncbi:MAG: transposase, partial [Hydrococcus sp. SU_1_0]|nr:transposase [Hydrococcus sp. SU_1_0]
MLNIERVLGQDRLVRAMTGLNRKAFEDLLPSFAVEYERVNSTLTKPRQRARGGGAKAKLENAQEKLFYILFYFKCYPTFDLAGVIFDLDRSQTHRWMHRLQPILQETLGKEMVLPVRKLRSIEEFIAYFPEVKEVIIDGTERPIQRPSNLDKQKQNYSGKKRRHTRKHLAGVCPNKQVLVLTHSREGKLHDQRFHDEEDIIGGIPDEIMVLLDSGFQGVQKDYDNLKLPHKKPRGGKLTDEQKQENRLLSSRRVICEKAFSGVKRYNAVAQVYRNRLSNFDDSLMLTACGLW